MVRKKNRMEAQEKSGMRKPHSTFPGRSGRTKTRAIQTPLPVAPGLARVQKLVAQHPSQAKKAGAEQDQCARLGSNVRRFGDVIV